MNRRRRADRLLHLPVPRRERCCSASTAVLIHNHYDQWVNPFSGLVEDFQVVSLPRPRTVSPQRIVMTPLRKETVEEQLQILFPQIRPRCVTVGGGRQLKRRSCKELEKPDYLESLKNTLSPVDPTLTTPQPEPTPYYGKDGIPLRREVASFIEKFYPQPEHPDLSDFDTPSHAYQTVLLARRRFGDSIFRKEVAAVFSITNATPTPSTKDLGMILCVFECMRQGRGVPMEVLRSHNWTFCGKIIDQTAFKSIDKSRCGLLTITDLVKHLYPAMQMKDIRSAVRTQYNSMRDPSFSAANGPRWLGKYPAEAVNDIYELFKGIGGDVHGTGLLHVEQVIDTYQGKAASRLVDGDIREVFQSEQIDLEKFAEIVNPAFDEGLPETASDP